MGPKKGKKRGKHGDDDEQFPDEEKILSKWNQALQKNKSKSKNRERNGRNGQ